MKVATVIKTTMPIVLRRNAWEDLAKLISVQSNDERKKDAHRELVRYWQYIIKAAYIFNTGKTMSSAAIAVSDVA